MKDADYYPENPIDLDQDYMSRRKFLRLTGVGILSLVAYKVIGDEGVHLLKPEISARRMDYKKEIANKSLAQVFIQSQRFFCPDRPLYISHRAGNTPQTVDLAVVRGANVLEMDLNVVNNKIYVKHGLLEQLLIASHPLNLVLDPTELEATIIQPYTFKQAIEHIAHLSTSENPLGVSMEFKHGPYEHDTIEEIINVLLKNNVPALIQSEITENLDRLLAICDARGIPCRLDEDYNPQVYALAA